jgi:WD40 repeat protein
MYPKKKKKKKKKKCHIQHDRDTKTTYLAITSINEHHDFSFACCWNPADNRTFATGNQDRTTRIYDIRNTSKAMCVLGSNVGAIRSLHYTHDGQYLAAAGTYFMRNIIACHYELTFFN